MRVAGCRPGFTLFELSVLAMLVGLGAGVALPAIERARDTARRTVDLSNLRQITMASVAYGMDHEDAIATYSWHAGMPVPQLATPEASKLLAAAQHDGQAAAAQAIDIIARRGGWTGIGFDPQWEPHLQHTALVLSDYLASRLPESIVVATGDETLAEMQGQLREMEGGPLPMPPGAPDTPASRMVAFGSSFQFVPAIADPAQSQWPIDRRTSAAVVQHPDRHLDLVITPDARLRVQRMSQVVFPSAKVLVHVDADYYSGRVPLHWSHPQAKLTVAMFDGAALEVETIDINPGWDPARPGEQNATTLLQVTPEPWERFEPIAAPTAGRMRWTRGGIRGIDLGGPEIKTSR